MSLTEQQKAAFHMGYLQALADLLEQTKSTPLLNREHLLKTLEKQVLQMKNGQ